MLLHHLGKHEPLKSRLFTHTVLMVCQSSSGRFTNIFSRKNESVPKIIINDPIIDSLNCNQHFGNFKQTIAVSERCLIKLIPYILFKNILISLHWKWPAHGTSTVPIVSAHFRSLYCWLSVDFDTAVCAYCYLHRCSVVTVSVCLLGTTKSCAKTAEPIEIPSGMWTRVGPRNLVLGGGPDLPKEGANLGVVLSHWKRIVTARAPKR